MGRISQKFTPNETQGEIHRVLCAVCAQKTRHLVVQSYDMSGEERFDEDYSIDWAGNYQVIQCQGCEGLSFRHLSFFSEEQFTHGEEYYDGTTELLYPQRTQDNRKTIAFFNAPVNLRRIYRETIEAFNSESATLAAAGLRALVEGICSSQGVKKGPVEVAKKGGGKKTQNRTNIEGKINGLAKMGILTQKNAAILHEHRFLGNEAVHELAVPSVEELVLAIEIIENLLDSLYEIPEKGLQLKLRRNMRSKKKGA